VYSPPSCWPRAPDTRAGTDEPGRREPTDLAATKLADALDRSGMNRSEIETFLIGQVGERKIAAEFLVANMPTVDLVSMRASDLEENLEYAFRAREELPWAADVPFELFLHYVLPHRVTQEPYESWRPALFEAMKTRLAGCTTMTDAAIAANYWCGQRTGFKQTEFRDQNVNSTLRSGQGRCEELMIVLISSLRAAGIPARPCSAPWWVVNDNNHAWVEVWADGYWYYAGGCEPAPALDRAWFGGPAQRAGVVVSTMYGHPEMYPTGEAVSRVMDNMAIINSTEVYAAPDEVLVTVLGPDRRPVPDCPVALSVFNYGGLRSLLVQETDESGQTTFVMGIGDFFVTAGNDDGRAHAIVTATPGADNDLTLTLERGTAPEAAFWLRYPTAAEAARYKAARPNAKPEAKRVFEPDLGTPEERDLYKPGKDVLLDQVLVRADDPDAWKAILEDSRANWRQIAGALKAARPRLHADLLSFMQGMSKVDRLEITAGTILDHVNWAAARRDRAMPEDLYRAYVLAGRIDREHVTAWRQDIGRTHADLAFGDPVATAEAVNAFLATAVKPVTGSRLGPIMNPIQVLRARRGTEREIAIAAVGMLRTFNVPARKTAAANTVEFHDGMQWRIFTPRDVDSMKLLADAGDEAAVADADVEVPGRVALTLMRDGEPIEASNRWPLFAVSRFEGGSWRPLRQFDVGTSGDATVVTLPEGEYLISAGARNQNGDPYVHTQLIDLAAGGEVMIDWDLALPQDAGVFRFEKVRELGAVPPLIVPDEQGEMVELAELVERSAVLLYFFRLDDEPSLRMVEQVRDVAPILREVGIRTYGIVMPSEIGVPFDEFLAQYQPSFPIQIEMQDDPAYAQLSDPDGPARWEMPSVMLLNRGGGVVLWMEGYELKIGELLQQASRQIR
jgi:transglutaminase-like putative cysteine protease